MSSKPMAALVLVVLLGMAAPNLQAQKPPDKPTPGDEMIYKYLCAETDKLSGKFLDGAKTLDEWQKKRPRLHQEYLDMLGLWPLPDKTPLKATITGTLQHEGVLIDNLHFQSKPGLYVTANLYRPKNPPAQKLPAIVYVCGHAWRGRDGNKSAHQDHGMWFASNGYVCLVLDTLQLGEIPGVHHGTFGTPYRHFKGYGFKDKDTIVENRFWWHSAGYTPAGVECWNGVRAIDYLVTRDDVDADKIGVTGISGGGAATFWIAAADERVKVAVPVSGMSDLESYVKNKVINGHCDCMFLYNTYQWDWTTIAALVAPRPLLFANSDDDKIFPMDGNRRIIEKLGKIYTMYGKPNLVDEYVSKGDHNYRPDLRVAVFRFINKHLKNDTITPVKDADFKPLPGKQLRVFATDDDLPKDALNGKIDETFVPRAKVQLPEKGQFEKWKKKLLTELKKRAFGNFPPQLVAAKLKGDLFESEPGVENRTFAGAPFGGAHGIWVRESEPKENPLRKDLMPFFEKDNFWNLLVRGTFERTWTMKSPPNYVARSNALLGRTVDSGRVWDIVGATKYLEEREKKPMKLIGIGQSGILAAYAGLWEPNIKEVIVIDPPKSHVEGPHFLGVLRVLDIPEALGLLAPTPLTLVNAQDPAFDRTAAIYKLAGAADKLTRK
jgi:dienelactone hydrolase